MDVRKNERPPVTHCMIFHQTRRRSRPPGRRSRREGRIGRSCRQTGRSDRAGLRRRRGGTLFRKTCTQRELEEISLMTAASAGHAAAAVARPRRRPEGVAARAHRRAAQVLWDICVKLTMRKHFSDSWQESSSEAERRAPVGSLTPGFFTLTSRARTRRRVRHANKNHTSQ